MQIGGGIKKVLGTRFECLKHGEFIKNWRKLENYIECNKEGIISIVRQRENTLVS